MSETRAQRQAALEERKRRLAELREARSRRAADTARVQSSSAASANLDDYVSTLLNEPTPGGEAPLNGETAETVSAAADSSGADNKLEASTAATNVAPQTQAADAPRPAAPTAPVKEVETFTIGTQTEVEQEEKEPDVDEPESEPAPNEPEAQVSPEDREPKVLSETELVKELAQTPFSDFLNNTSKKMERVLGTALLKDLLVDPMDESTATNDNGKTSGPQLVADQQVFECPKWTGGREITDINWSPLRRDLMLTSYGASSGAGQQQKSSHNVVTTAGSKKASSGSLTPRSGELQADGLVALWSMSLLTRPEHLLTTGSPVTTASFHPSEPKWIVAGCASGQVVVWDLRTGGRLPVQKSAAGRHIHAAGFVTSSSDGKVNYWSLSNLRDPAESLQIGDSISSLAVAPESGGTLVLGDDNGALHVAAASSSGQRRRQIRKLAANRNADTDASQIGHYGMVTAVATKSLKKPKNESLVKGFLRGSGGLVLTAGVDWTVQLWAPAYRDSPLTSLVSHSYDSMSDVCWSPTHPALFATASSNGKVGLWNLGLSVEEPVESFAVDADNGLNKVSWSLDGRRLAAASADKLHLLSLTEEALRSQKADEDERNMMNQFLSRGWISNRS